MTTDVRLAGAGRFLIVASAGLALGAMIVIGGLIFSFAVPILVALAAVTLIVRAFTPAGDTGVRAQIFHWTMLAFVLHFGFGVLVTNLLDLAPRLTPDTLAYHEKAIELVRHWTGDFPAPPLPRGKEGYYLLLGGIYFIFGSHMVAGLAVNAVLGAALVPILSDTTNRLFGPAAARYVAPIVVFLPGLLIWTSQLLKEAPILFLIAIVSNFAVRTFARFSLSLVASLAVALGLLLTFRAWIGFGIAGAVVLASVLGRRHLLSGFGSGLTLLAISAGIVVSVGLGYSGYRVAVTSDLEYASSVRRDLASTGTSGYQQEADISSARRAASYLPTGLVHFVFGPFPWRASGRQLLAIPDVLIWWALLPSLWRGLREGRRRAGRSILVLLLPAIAIAVLMALVLGNYGTLVRERLQAVVLVVPFIALGLAMRSGKRRPAIPPELPALDAPVQGAFATSSGPELEREGVLATNGHFPRVSVRPPLGPT